MSGVYRLLPPRHFVRFPFPAEIRNLLSVRRARFAGSQSRGHLCRSSQVLILTQIPCSPKSLVPPNPLLLQIPCSSKSPVHPNPLFPQIPCSPKSPAPPNPLLLQIPCSPKSPVHPNPLFPQILCSPKSPVPPNPLLLQIPCSPKSPAPLKFFIRQPRLQYLPEINAFSLWFLEHRLRRLR